MIAVVMNDLKLLFNGLFGYNSRWESLESIELDLFAECEDFIRSKSMYGFLTHLFPKDEWFKVIHQCPKLSKISLWESDRKMEEKCLIPFTYSLMTMEVWYYGWISRKHIQNICKSSGVKKDTLIDIVSHKEECNFCIPLRFRDSLYCFPGTEEEINDAAYNQRKESKESNKRQKI